jgi:putative ABC transport system permease protein
MTALRDLRYAIRSLARVPGFTTAVVLTLALGIGANTAIFSVVRGTLLRPLPNRDGTRLLYLRQSAVGAGQDNIAFSVPEIIDYRTASRSLRAIAEFSASTYTMLDHDEPMRVQNGLVSGNYFDVMGLAPVVGRVLNASDDGPNAPPVMVLTHEFWTRRLGGDPGVIGKTFRLNNTPVEVVGVVQPAPHYPGRTDMFTNLVVSPHHLSATMVHGRTHRMTEVFGRLAPGATVEQARAEVAQIARTMHGDHPEVYEQAATYRTEALPLHDALSERAALMFWLLMGAAGFVLLIACANVANLTLIRTIRRERELLVRRALGAGAARLRRLLLAENLLLAGAGATLGIGVAWAGLRLLVAFAEQLTARAGEIRLDGLVLAFTLAIALAAAIALAFVPRVGAEGSLASRLHRAGKRTSASHGRQRLQRGLVVAQVAVCVVLLTGAGLLVRTLVQLSQVDTGLDPENVLTMEIPTAGAGRTPQQVLALREDMQRRIRELPGVREVALGSNVPLRGSGFALEVKAEGRAAQSGEPTPNAEYRTASAEFFLATGIPVLSGRAFATTDRVDAPRVVVLNKTLADRLFPNVDPIGRRVAWTGEVLRFIGLSGDWRTVVGVVGDTRDAGLDAAPVPVMYQPVAQEIASGAVVIRTTGNPDALAPAVRRIIREQDSQQLVENVLTLEQVRDQGVAPRRINAMLISMFGILALVIAAVGIAGVLAFSVSSRTGEIGIRMSLGADASRVQRMVLGEGWIVLAVGLVLGIAGSFAATRLLTRLLFGVAPFDPLTMASVMTLMAVVGSIACWIPALRAARVEPSVALRAE